MVKVVGNVNRGPQDHYIYKETCEHCDSILEFQASDVHETYWGDEYIKCPHCKRRVYISPLTYLMGRPIDK